MEPQSGSGENGSTGRSSVANSIASGVAPTTNPTNRQGRASMQQNASSSSAAPPARAGPPLSSNRTASPSSNRPTLPRVPSSTTNTGGIGRQSSSDEPLITFVSGTESQAGSSASVTPRKVVVVSNTRQVVEGQKTQWKGPDGSVGSPNSAGRKGNVSPGFAGRGDSNLDSPSSRGIAEQQYHQQPRGQYSPTGASRGLQTTVLSPTTTASLEGGFGVRLETPTRGTNPSANSNSNNNNNTSPPRMQQRRETQGMDSEPMSPFFVRESFSRGPLMTEEESVAVNMISDNRYRPLNLEERIESSSNLSPKRRNQGGGGGGDGVNGSNSPTFSRNPVTQHGGRPQVERNALYSDGYPSGSQAGGDATLDSPFKSQGRRKYISGNFQHNSSASPSRTNRDESLTTIHNNSNDKYSESSGNWSTGPKGWLSRRKKGKEYIKEHYGESNHLSDYDDYDDGENINTQASYWNSDDSLNHDRGGQQPQEQQNRGNRRNPRRGARRRRRGDGGGGGGNDNDERETRRSCVDTLCAIPRYAAMCLLDACSGCIFACTFLRRLTNGFMIGMFRGTSAAWLLPRVLCAIVILPCCIGAMIAVFAYTTRTRFANRTDWVVISFIGIVHQIAFLVPLTDILSPWSAWELKKLGLFKTDFVGPIVLYILMSLYWTSISLRMYVSVQKWWKSVWPIMGSGKRDGQQRHHHHSRRRRRSAGTESWSRFANAYAQGYHGDHDEDEEGTDYAQRDEPFDSSGPDSHTLRTRGNRAKVNSEATLWSNSTQQKSRNRSRRKKGAHQRHSRQRRRDRNALHSGSSSASSSNSRSSSSPSSTDWCEDAIVPQQILESSSFPPALQQHLNTRLHEQMLAQRILSTAQLGSTTASPLTTSRRQLPTLPGQQRPTVNVSSGATRRISPASNSKDRAAVERFGINSLSVPLLDTTEPSNREGAVNQTQSHVESSVVHVRSAEDHEQHHHHHHHRHTSRHHHHKSSSHHPRDSDSHSSSTQPHMEQRSSNEPPASMSRHRSTRSHDGNQSTSSRSGMNKNENRSRSTSANPHRRQRTMSRTEEDCDGCGGGGGDIGEEVYDYDGDRVLGVSREGLANPAECTGQQMDEIRKRVSIFLEELHRSTKIRTHFVIIPGVLLGTTMALLTRLCLWSGSPHCTATFSFTQEPFSTSIYYWLAALFWVLEFIVLATTVIFVFVLYYQQLMRVETFTYEKQSDTQLVGSILNPDNLFMWVKIWMLLIQEVRRRPTIQSTTYGTVVFSVLGIIGTASYTVFDNLGGMRDTAVFTISATAIGLVCLSTLSGLIWVTVRLQRVVRYEMHLIARVQTNVQQHLDLLKDDVDDGAARLLLTKINCLKALDAYIRTSESRPKLAGMTLETFRTSAILISLIFVNVAFFLLYIMKCYTPSE